MSSIFSILSIPKNLAHSLLLGTIIPIIVLSNTVYINAAICGIKNEIINLKCFFKFNDLISGLFTILFRFIQNEMFVNNVDKENDNFLYYIKCNGIFYIIVGAVGITYSAIDKFKKN